MANKNVPVRNIGSKGVITDLAAYDIPVEAWSNARNVRFIDGKATKIGGTFPLFYKNRANVDSEQVKQFPLHFVQKPLSTESWYWASADTIWETNGWNHTKIVKEGTNIASNFLNPWSSTILANSVIMNTAAMDPVGRAPDESTFRRLPNWGPWKAQLVRSYKNFALALNTTEGSATYSQRVRWSNIVPPNSLPADWGWKYDNDDGTPVKPVPTNPTFIDGSAGGYNDLTMAVGNILDGAELKDQFIIYTDHEVLALDYVGGNEIFRARKIFSDAGILNTNCVAIFDNKHFVISAGDIYVHNGSSKQSIVAGKIRNKIMEELTEYSDRIKTLTYESEKEIWVFYAGPDTSKLEEFTRAAIYNWLHDTWSFVDIPRALDIQYGPVPVYVNADTKVETWDLLEDSELWNNTLKLWSGIGRDLKDQALLISSTDGNFYSLDQGDYNISLKKEKPTDVEYKLETTEITAQLTKNYIDMDQLGGDIVGYKHILAVYPQIQGDGEFYFRVGGSHQPSGSVEWGPRENFVVGSNHKVDTRKNYRYISLQVDNLTAGTWAFTGYDFIVRAGGRR